MNAKEIANGVRCGDTLKFGTVDHMWRGRGINQSLRNEVNITKKLW